MTMLPSSQNRRRALYRYLMYAMIGVLAVLALISRVTDVEVDGPTTAVVIVIGLVSVLQFGALDEVARQAHYIAWFWGSMLGLIPLGVLAFGLATDALPFAAVASAIAGVHGRLDLELSFLMGLLTGPMLLTLGFFVWWTVHWLRMSR